MSSINTGKLIAGGLAAGLVINIVEVVVNLVLIGDSGDEMLANLGLDPVGGAAITGFIVIGFLLGILIVWTYAAIRTRYGPGPGTAMKAGTAVWAAFYLLGGTSNWLMGIAPTGMLVTVLIYSLVMILAAAYVGGMVYKEDGSAPTGSGGVM